MTEFGDALSPFDGATTVMPAIEYRFTIARTRRLPFHLLPRLQLQVAPTTWPRRGRIDG